MLFKNRRLKHLRSLITLLSRVGAYEVELRKPHDRRELNHPLSNLGPRKAYQCTHVRESLHCTHHMLRIAANLKHQVTRSIRDYLCAALTTTLDQEGAFTARRNGMKRAGTFRTRSLKNHGPWST
jgi:hypothetical protein